MADYKPDRKGTGGVMRSAEMHMALIDIAYDEGIPFAQSISPDVAPFASGYIDSFRVDGSHTVRIAGTRRAECRIVNDSPYASAVEYGWDVEHGQWADHPGYHVMAMTADYLSGII